VQVRGLIERHPDYFPMYTVGGKWSHGGEAWTNWCEGFLGGQMWLLYRHTGDPYWRTQAEHYSRLVEHRKADRNVHDLGFVFWSTWKRWYDLDGDPALNAVVIDAGRTMGLRGDGSVSHEGIFDLSTGEFLKQTTQQGWRDDSSWARGLTWALYGYGTVYSFTHDLRFLHTAEACADFYIERTPAHGVPPNDWDEPAPALPNESSAATIAASGLFTLAKLTQDSAKAAGYRDYAQRILLTLTSPEFLANGTPGWEGILKHGMYHQRKGLGVDESVMWGEYFFVEALSKALGEE
jgi:unsaturated chondroitin disaccharide hydrolase